MNLWNKSGNKCFSICFDKFNLSNIVKYTNNNSVKGVDSFCEKNLWLFGFKFTFIDVDYDNIVFVKINSNNNYIHCNDFHKINVIKETLSSWINNNTYDKQYPPFNWNFAINKDNSIDYYITAPKKWFQENDVQSLITPLREITFNERSYYFPKYNPRKTNQVINLSMYKK